MRLRRKICMSVLVYFHIGGTCATCTAGTYSLVDSTTCVNCTAGTYSLADSTTCVYCESGKFSGAGSTACFDCAAGNCNFDVCPPGQYSASTAVTCIASTPTSASCCQGGVLSTGVRSGKISEDGYPYLDVSKKMDCTWIIGPSKQISLKFDYLYMQGYWNEASSWFAQVVVSTCTTSNCTLLNDSWTLSNTNSLLQGNAYIHPAYASFAGYYTNPYITTTGTYLHVHWTTADFAQYSDGFGATWTAAANACDSCPANSQSPLGSQDVTKCVCKAGYSKSSVGTCDACAAGKYSGADSTCQNCTAGQYSPVGSASCMNCSAGQYSSAGSICLNCAAGSVSPTGSTGPAACTQCAAGKYTITAGSSVCIDCGAGKYSAATSATISTTCVSCGAGTYSTIAGATVCANCSAGLSSASTGATATGACTPCVAGKFTTSAGSSTCVSCVTGTYQDAQGATSCIRCSPGKSSGVGWNYCGQCPGGKYSDNTTTYNQYTTCVPCAAGTYSWWEASSCTACEYGQTSIVESNYCWCDVGYEHWRTDGDAYGYDTGCAACSAGKYKGTAGNLVFCTACPGAAETGGTYSNTPGATTCTACPANTVSANLSASVSCICAKEYTIL